MSKPKKITSMQFPHITLLNFSRFCFLSAVVAILTMAFTVLAAKPEDFSGDQIAAIWSEVWKTGDPKIKERKIEKLAEGDVVQRMAGTWTVTFGVAPDKLVISLSTNHVVEIPGRKDGVAWKKGGQWRVISDKLVLFLKEDNLPSFIFMTGQRPYIFDPWAKTMMSELKQEK